MVSPKFHPASNAATLAARISGLPANLDFRKPRVPSVGRLYIHERSPSANMFFARWASFLEMSNSSSALTVIEVRGTWLTLYSDSEPSDSGSLS